MVRVTFFQQKGVFDGFLSEGHAAYDEEGWDIVCAAVSALTQTILAACLEQLSCGDEVRWKVQKGFLEMDLPEQISQEDQKTAEVLLKALWSGLKMIQEQYPEYVSVVIKRNGR